MRTKKIGPPILTPKKKNKPIKKTNLLCWVGLLLALCGVIVLVIVLVSTPYPVTTFYRDEATARINCTIGEELDDDLEMCVPVHSEIAVLRNNSVKACDSFYHHVAGTWITTHKNENRAFTYVYRKNLKQVHDLIRSPESGAVYRFFRSCLDTLVNGQHVALDESQVTHLMEHILRPLQSHADLPIVFARLAQYGFESPFLMSIESHPTETIMVPLIRWEAHDFALPQMKEWASADNDQLESSESFVAYVRSPLYSRHMTTMGALYEISPPNFWKLYLRELNGYAMEEDLENAMRPAWVITPHYMRAFLTGMTTIPIKEWREYVRTSITYNTKRFVPEFPPDSYFRRSADNPIRRPHRTKRRKRDDSEITEHTCLSVTHRMLPGLVGQTYLTRYMKNYKQVQGRIIGIMNNVRDAFAELIQKTDWLHPNTRTVAVDKVKSIVARAIVPNHWELEPFEDRITMDCYLRNLNMIRKYRASRNYELWTKDRPNRDHIQRFSAPLTEVNAFYSGTTNTITYFSGLAQEPFYGETYSDAAVYASVGAICGHELAHAMDPSGRMFDKDGNVRETWKESDIAEFNKRIQAVIADYGAPNGCENAKYGEQTVGEDIADGTGLRAAYRAFNAVKQRTDGEKREFFETFALIWAESYDQKEMCAAVADDVHAIGSYRVDKTLRSNEDFQILYGCTKTDPMVNKDHYVLYGEAWPTPTVIHISRVVPQ